MLCNTLTIKVLFIKQFMVMSTNGMFSGKFQHRALVFNLALFQLAPALVSWDNVPVVQEAGFWWGLWMSK